MKRSNYSIVLMLLLMLINNSLLAQSDISKYNVILNTTSQNETGNVPIDNGSLGSNIWIEENGDMLLYLSRNDFHSELQRLLKLGRVRISFSNNPFGTGKPFNQMLNIKDGVININRYAFTNAY